MPMQIKFPKRKPSLIVPPREIVYITPDKTTCEKCDCYPKESPYRKKPKLNPCLISPLTLYELAAEVIDSAPFPEALRWTVEEVTFWMEEIVGLPQYMDCIEVNHIDGMRLLMLEDPSKLPKMNINDFEHIKMITALVRKEYSTEFIKFARSIGLPPRKPLTHCTWFKSRTGPIWGIRQNWTRSDILRWMKILDPKPIYLDHWDLVWYEKPEFPKTLFARIPKDQRIPEDVKIPRFIPRVEVCNEYQVPRKFRLNKNIPPDAQFIWMEHRPGSPSWQEPIQKPKKEKKIKPKEESKLMPKKICLKGLSGKELILARRLMPKPKFLAK